ncbi:MAG: HU family DNA-binding protein [bacterium]
MNKNELTELIAQKTGNVKKQTEDMLEALTNTITEELKNGREVAITGFGAFSAKERKAREGVNPRNPSEKIHIPAVKVPKFKAGKALKDALKSQS